MINNSFKSVPLKDVVYFQEGPGLRNWQYGSSGVPFLNIRTITDDGTIDKSLCQYVKQDEFEGKYEHFLLEEGDFVVSSSGTLGKLAEIRTQDLPLMLNTSVIRFRPLDLELLDRAYLKWFIKSPLYVRQIQKASTGTAIKNYGPSHLKQMVILLPPLEEQRRIAAILDKADEVRRKRKQAIALTEELLRSLFLDMFGDPVTNPKGWEILELQQLCSVIVDCPHKTPSYSENITPYPCIRSSDIQRGYIDLSTTKYVERHHYKIRTKRHVPVVDDIIYCREGARFGNAALVPKDMNLCLGQRMMLLQADKSKAESIFLCFLLNTKGVYLQAAKLVAGSASPHVNVGDIKKIRVFCPPIERQFLFRNFAKKNEFIRQKLLSSLEITNLNFNSLLQKAFRGKL